MARSKKIVTDTAQVDITPVNPLALVVKENKVGYIVTNIADIENYVADKLTEYKPELYDGDSDAAKKDRAELNNSKKFLGQMRLQIMREAMKPYADFEARCKKLEKDIDAASAQLDEIVKAKEAQEKSLKQMRITEIWLSRGFNLVPLEKVQNPKWLNKSTKELEIADEIDAIIQRIYSDLKRIEMVSEVCDAETVKAFYLDCLDIGKALDYGETLVKNRDAIKREAEERQKRELDEQIARQEKEQRREMVHLAKNEPVQSLAFDALDLAEEQKKPVVKDYVVSVQATAEQLNQLKAAMNALKIVFSVEELAF